MTLIINFSSFLKVLANVPVVGLSTQLNYNQPIIWILQNNRTDAILTPYASHQEHHETIYHSNPHGHLVYHYAESDQLLEFVPLRCKILKVSGVLLEHDLKNPQWSMTGFYEITNNATLLFNFKNR